MHLILSTPPIPTTHYKSKKVEAVYTNYRLRS